MKSILLKLLPKELRQGLTAMEALIKSFDTKEERDYFVDTLVDCISNGEKVSIFIDKGSVSIVKKRAASAKRGPRGPRGPYGPRKGGSK